MNVIASAFSGSAKRDFDVVLFGATGYTGRLAAEYLVQNYFRLDSSKKSDEGLKFALAGQNETKMQILRDVLVSKFSESLTKDDLTIIIANSKEYESLRTMCSRTKVLMTTVGPFALYGEAVVKACIESRCHYCDITGEFAFVRRMQQKYLKEAKAAKVKIVHFCGFDSVPSDIGVLLLQQHAKNKFGKPCETIRYRLTEFVGGISGGTIASMANMHKNDISLEDMKDPYYLCENAYFESHKKPHRVVQPEFPLSLYDTEVGYSSYFIMSQINTKVVNWTNYLLNYSYGKDFKYNEGMALGHGNLLCKLITLLIRISLFLFSFASIRWLMTKLFLPKPGEGPSRDILEKSRFWAKVLGQCTDNQGNTHLISATVGTNDDPGYKGTSKMLCECGIALAKNIEACSQEYGILSPASGIGLCLINRLNEAGLTFKLDE